MTGDVQQGVAGISGHHLKLTDDIAAVGGQEEGRAPTGDRPAQKQHQDMQTEYQSRRCCRSWKG